MTEDRQSTLVLAVGGNAHLQPCRSGTCEEQVLDLDSTTAHIADLRAAGHRIIIVCGNGSGIGNILTQQVALEAAVAPLPMDVAGAMYQGQVGYLLGRRLENHLRRAGDQTPVVCLVTETVVDQSDPAFAAPSRPVGPFYDEQRARHLSAESGFAMRDDSGHGRRRAVPSPEPVEIVQLPAIERLLEAGALVVCAGGGGIPVLRSHDGTLSGAAAVIDEGRVAARLALDIGADALVVLTDALDACLDCRGPQERALRMVQATEMRGYLEAGQFAAGSMRMKGEACLRLAEAGRTGIIASLTEVAEAVDGRAGIWIIPDGALCMEPEWISSDTLVTWRVSASRGGRL